MTSVSSSLMRRGYGYARNASHQSKPPAVAPHNLDNESAGVAISCRINVVDSLANTLQSCGCSDGQISHAHVVVDRADKADDLEVCMGFQLLFGDQRWEGVSERQTEGRGTNIYRKGSE